MPRLPLTDRSPWITIEGAQWLIVGTYGAQLRVAQVGAVDPETRRAQTKSGVVYTVDGKWPDVSSIPRLTVIMTDTELSDRAILTLGAALLVVVSVEVVFYVCAASAVFGWP